jgi:hypothetical protein
VEWFENWHVALRFYWKLFLTFVLLCPLVALPHFHMARVSASPDVFANPEQIRYEGSGGLVLPASVDTSIRNEVVHCRGCGWKLTAACIPGPDNYCDAAIRGCPGLLDHMRVWFQPAGGDWKEVDRICLTHYEVTTVADIERRAIESFERYVPKQDPRCWPEKNAVTNLPLLCGAGQSTQAVSWSIPVAGFSVGITTTPSWHWDFAGSSLRTNQSGGPYPDRAISHTFRKAGHKEIGLRTKWSGNIRIDSLDQVEIAADLLQNARLTVTIGQALARLRCPGVRSC